MVGVTAAIIGASVLGAGASIISGNKAAKAQQKGNDQAVAESRRQYDTTRADFEPWRTAGAGALAQLQRLYGLTPNDTPHANPTTMDNIVAGENDYGGLQLTPGYQFRFDEGQRAVERSAASRGLLRSGASQKAIARYGEGLAASEYDSYARRLAEMAGIGLSATGATAASGDNASNNIANLYAANGNARASSYLNTGNAINQGLNNIVSAYTFNKGWGK